VFAERGYRDTTIAAIADAANVAVSTVTGHFPAKEDLLFADEPFAAASLVERLAARDGEPAPDAFRDWMATTMAALTAERTREIVRLEQGRATTPSGQVVAALPRALQLTRAECDHLYSLAGLQPPGDRMINDHISPGV
jgi:AcrR family transcriptional regulator